MLFTKRYYVNTTDEVDVISVIHECRYAIRDSKSADGLLTAVATQAGAAFVIMPAIQDAIDELKASMDVFGAEAGSAPDRLKRERAIGPIVQSAILGRTVHLPFHDGMLILDPYDEVFLVDFERKGGRREFVVQIISDAAPPVAAPQPKVGRK